MRFARLTCRGCRGGDKPFGFVGLAEGQTADGSILRIEARHRRQRPDFKSYAAACTPRAGAFLRQGACDQSKKAFLADFTARRFSPVYTF